MSHGSKLIVWASISALVALGCGDDFGDGSTASDAPTDVGTESDATTSSTEDNSDGTSSETGEPFTDGGGESEDTELTDGAVQNGGKGPIDGAVETADLNETDREDSDTDGFTNPVTDPGTTDGSTSGGTEINSDAGGAEINPDVGGEQDLGQLDIPADTPLVNDGMGSLGGEPQEGLTLLNSNVLVTDFGGWLWLGVVQNTTDDSTFCRISVDGVMRFDTGDEVEFLGGAVIAPMYSPPADSLTLPCVSPGETGVLTVLAKSLLNGVKLSQVVGISYGVSAEDWTANELARLELLTLSDVEATETGAGTVIAGTVVNGDETLTGVKAFVLPSTTSGIPLRYFEVAGPDLGAGESWDFNSPAVDVQFSDQIIHFAYTRQ